MCLEASLVFVSFLSKVAGKVAVWIGNWVTNEEECCWTMHSFRLDDSVGGMRKGVESMKSREIL